MTMENPLFLRGERHRNPDKEKRKQAHDRLAMCLLPWEVEREKYEKKEVSK